MAQPATESSYRGLDVFWHGVSDPLGGLGQKFQLVVIAKEEIDFENLLDVTTAKKNAYPTLEEPANTKEAQCERTGRLAMQKRYKSEEKKKLADQMKRKGCSTETL